MKRRLLLVTMSIFTIILMVFPLTFGVKPSNCILAQDIYYSAGHYNAGQPIPIGFDEYGYNYQAHLFVGSYFNVYSGGAGYPVWEGDDDTYLADNPGAASHWAWPYREIQLEMKWNDAWLSNKDQDLDGKLDRHYGYPSYIGSGAWETNQMRGENEDGSKWAYFTKIVAAPADATLDAGIWYTAEGTEIGPVIWGEFATILEVEQGVLYLSPNSAGFGAYMPTP